MPTGTFADRVVTAALTEWEFFGRQAYNAAGHMTQAGHKETEPGFAERIGVFWSVGVKIPGVDGNNTDQPWSAAFISWLMRTSGAEAQFHYAPQHSVYISRAIADRAQGVEAGYWGFRLDEERPAMGDLVCWSRQPGIDFDHQHGGNYNGHTDLVVEVRPDAVDVIGGNVGDSVSRRTLALDANGFLRATTQGGEVLFALMQNRIA